MACKVINRGFAKADDPIFTRTYMTMWQKNFTPSDRNTQDAEQENSATSQPQTKPETGLQK